MDFFVHLLVPSSSNNHRAKVLHHQSLFLLVLSLLAVVIFLPLIRERAPSILGFATDISIEKLTELTNAKRRENGLQPLLEEPALIKAAKAKAEHMFSQDYWAHNGPDGKTPWFFIVNEGYQYVHAGENLAKDFDSTEAVLEAWMASQGHRANILSPNYQDIGFAVVNGKLNGRETTLVVQLFGIKKGQEVRLPVSPSRQLVRGESVFAAREKPLIDSKVLTRNMVISIVTFLILVFALDMVVIYRKRLARFVGHNVDHIILLGSLIPVILKDHGGVIL